MPIARDNRNSSGAADHVARLGHEPQIFLGRGKRRRPSSTARLPQVRELRARRDSAAVDAALEGVRQAARDGTNLVPPCLVAVKAYATHGEICNAMRDVFGVHTADSQLMGI